MIMLEAVWLKNGKEVYKVSPVKNIVCDDDMEDISEIEVSDGSNWYSCESFDTDADDFLIRVKKD